MSLSPEMQALIASCSVQPDDGHIVYIPPRRYDDLVAALAAHIVDEDGEQRAMVDMILSEVGHVMPDYNQEYDNDYQRIRNKALKLPVGEHRVEVPGLAVDSVGQHVNVDALIEKVVASINTDLDIENAQIDEEEDREAHVTVNDLRDDVLYLLAGGVGTNYSEYVDSTLRKMALDSWAPADPWPDLTREKLRDLIGVARRDENWSWEMRDAFCSWQGCDKSVPAPALTLAEKIVVAHHRDKLLDDADRTSAEKKREASEKRRSAKAAKHAKELAEQAKLDRAA